MIEHVRRRAVMASCFSEVFVATCDQSVREVVEHSGGNVLMTSKSHLNGISRAGSNR